MNSSYKDKIDCINDIFSETIEKWHVQDSSTETSVQDDIDAFFDVAHSKMQNNRDTAWQEWYSEETKVPDNDAATIGEIMQVIAQKGKSKRPSNKYKYPHSANPSKNETDDPIKRRESGHWQRKDRVSQWGR